MILASELRIGNLIYAEVGLPSMDLHSVKASDFKGIENGEHHVEPIPLTDNWLLEFGFIKKKNCGYYDSELMYWHHKDMVIYIDSLGISLGYEGGEYHECEPVNEFYIKTVHQLQNIYHSLTGQELTIK